MKKMISVESIIKSMIKIVLTMLVFSTVINEVGVVYVLFDYLINELFYYTLDMGDTLAGVVGLTIMVGMLRLVYYGVDKVVDFPKRFFKKVEE